MHDSFKKGFMKVAGPESLIYGLGKGVGMLGKTFRGVAGIPKYLERAWQGLPNTTLEQAYHMGKVDKALHNSMANPLIKKEMEMKGKMIKGKEAVDAVKQKAGTLGKRWARMPTEDKLMYGIPGVYLAGKTIDAAGSNNSHPVIYH